MNPEFVQMFRGYLYVLGHWPFSVIRKKKLIITTLFLKCSRFSVERHHDPVLELHNLQTYRKLSKLKKK